MKNTVLKLKKRLAMIALLAMAVTQSAFAADIYAPSDVENVRAVAGDESVTLSWDVASDNIGVTSYKIYYGLESVTAENGQYAFEENTGDVISYTLDGLENGVTYYFAVTAVDAEGNESEHYSFEVNATPVKPVVQAEQSTSNSQIDDGRAPAVRSAQSYSSTQIKVVFSENVVLPSEEPQTAFLVEDALTGEYLPLLDAEVLDDEMNTVVLETALQDVGTEYIVTAGINVEDAQGNAVQSGTSDTATFLGGDGEYIPVNVDETVAMTAPVEMMDESVDTLPADEVENTDSMVEETLPETTMEIADILPPEAVTNLIAEINDLSVTLTWNVSVSEDTVDQVVYQAESGGGFMQKAILSPFASEFEVNDLVAGMTYLFKVTARDSAGNESEGTLVEVTLPETGPGLALMFGISALGTAVIRKKRS